MLPQLWDSSNREEMYAGQSTSGLHLRGHWVGICVFKFTLSNCMLLNAVAIVLATSMLLRRKELLFTPSGFQLLTRPQSAASGRDVEQRMTSVDEGPVNMCCVRSRSAAAFLCIHVHVQPTHRAIVHMMSSMQALWIQACRQPVSDGIVADMTAQHVRMVTLYCITDVKAPDQSCVVK